jgi:MFS family permease
VTEPARRPPPPFLYFILFLPFGATTAFVTTTIVNMWSRGGVHDPALNALMATHALPDAVKMALAPLVDGVWNIGTALFNSDARGGISEAALGAMVAANILPHTFKVLWAPLVDTVWNGRAWYIVGNLVSSVAIVATGLVAVSQQHMHLLTTLVIFNGFATTFVGMTTEALMAHVCPPEQRGMAAGWSQAGNVGGGVVGGLALILYDQTAITWLPGLVVGITLMSCSVVLLWFRPIHPIDRPTFFAAAKELVRDIRGIFWSRNGVIAAALCLLPIGSGAAANLFAAQPFMAEWGVSTTLVAFLNGAGGGVAAMLGSLTGGKLSDRIEKKRAYALSGVMLALAAFAMALMPRSMTTYVVWVLAYQFALGMCYAAFTGFVLDIIGKGAAATKYNLLASLANIPITLMGGWDGRVSDHYGHGSMLWFDGAMGVAGAAVLMLIVLIALPRRQSSSA